jgi:hypothetical protein
MILLPVIMDNGVLLSVVMLKVAAPKLRHRSVNEDDDSADVNTMKNKAGNTY